MKITTQPMDSLLTLLMVHHATRMQKELKRVEAPAEVVIVKNTGHNWRPVDGTVAPSRQEIIERTVQFIVDLH